MEKVIMVYAGNGKVSFHEYTPEKFEELCRKAETKEDLTKDLVELIGKERFDD